LEYIYKQKNYFSIYLFLDLKTQAILIIRDPPETSSNNKTNELFVNKIIGLFVLNLSLEIPPCRFVYFDLLDNFSNNSYNQEKTKSVRLRREAVKKLLEQLAEELPDKSVVFKTICEKALLKINSIKSIF
jgi:hypothetical protein